MKSRTGRCPPRAAEKYPRLAVAVVTLGYMSLEDVPVSGGSEIPGGSNVLFNGTRFNLTLPCRAHENGPPN